VKRSVQRNEAVHTALCDFGGAVYNTVCWEGRHSSLIASQVTSSCAQKDRKQGER
jgi:hypothetical protein